MNFVRRLRDVASVTQVELARRAGTSQPTVAAYETGAKSPSLSTVKRLASALGLEAFVDFYPPMTREDRRSLLLHEKIAAHLMETPATVLEQARKNLRNMARRAPEGTLWDDWKVLLRCPIEIIVVCLTTPAPWARELRHVTPFAGVLTAEERAEVYAEFRRQESRRIA